jgi:hypothetical protein
MTEFNPCPVCRKSDFVSRTARDNHVYRCRKRKYESAKFPQVERAFEGLEPQTKENREIEKPKSTEEKTRQTPKKFTGSDILQIYEAQATIVKTDLETGRIADFSDAVEELETRLLASGISKERVKDFVRIFKHRLSVKRENFSQPKQIVQAQPQPQPREPTLTEQAEIEAQKVNAQRGYTQLIERNWACEICGRGNMTKDEAISCENSHQVATTQENEPETPSQQEPEIERPRQIQPQSLPQSDIVIKGIKSLLGRIVAPQRQKETKTEEQTQPQEEAYSPITYMNTVRWQSPEPIESQECKICGRIDYVSNFRAGLHGRGVCN